MDAERLLAKLEFQAERAWEKQRREQRIPAAKLPTKSEQCLDKLRQLRAKTAEITAELELRHQVEVESERHLAATMKLREANRTPAERKARAEETRSFQIRLSRVTSPEQHPDWRAHAAAEFANKGRK
jgi:hypothetical protein